jgi:hypothetical protein
MISVMISGGDRSTMVNGFAYDLSRSVIFLKFRSSDKWYAKSVPVDVLMEAIGVWLDTDQSFGKWAHSKSITKDMVFFTDVDL